MPAPANDPRLAALAALFVAWWAVSAVNQIGAGRLTRGVRRRLPFGVIPFYTFFAPNPARADSRLVWRAGDGSAWDGWQEVHFGRTPPAVRWLVNPHLVENKAVTDLVNSLHRLDPETVADRTALFSSAYLGLLGLVETQARRTGRREVQFAVVETAWGARERSLRVVFLSEAHALGDGRVR